MEMAPTPRPGPITLADLLLAIRECLSTGETKKLSRSKGLKDTYAFCDRGQITKEYKHRGDWKASDKQHPIRVCRP